MLVFSFIYSLLILFGVYGFGTDYYAAYRFETYTDLGWSITTMHIGNLAFGIALSSFLISYSFGSILMIDSRINRYAFPKFSYLLFLHSWPIIMFSLNVSRQGLLVALFYFLIYFYILNYRRVSWLIVFLISQIHKLFIVVTPIFLLSIISARLKYISKSTRYIFIFLSVFFITSVVVYKNIFLPVSHSEKTRVIGGDFSDIFFILNIFYILLYIINIRLLSKNLIGAILFYGSASLVAIYLLGYSWQYERINMVFLLLYVIFFRQFIHSSLRKVYYIVISTTLFAFSIYQGILQSLR